MPMPSDSAVPWWRTAVFYQIYPRSFADANGDGIGDLDGIRQHLDHLHWLGVDALWLSPFYESPMADGGYDVSDHCAVAPLFGTLADFDHLLVDAHALGLRVIIDFVGNHTSDRHPWFQESRASRDVAKRSWYVWHDEPNNWVAAFGAGSAWTFDGRTGQRYLHLFLPEQPDLDWRCTGVVDAMHDVMRFWLDRGVDGFRMDAVHCMGKDPTFADDPRCARGQPLSDFNDQPFTHDILRGVRRVIDRYGGEPVLLGEVDLRSPAKVAQYYGEGDELQLAFEFSAIDAPWDAAAFRTVIEDVEHSFGAADAWPAWVLSNHDNSRHRTRYGGSIQRARAAALLLLTLRGTPFVYQGEELGLCDAFVAPERRVDPGGRDPERAPLPWERDAPHGWKGAQPWLPFPPDPTEMSVQAQVGDPTSVLRLYRSLLAARRKSAALSRGGIRVLDSPADTLAYERFASDDRRVVLVNFASEARTVALEGEWRVELRSDTGMEWGRYDGTLPGDTALLLARA